MNNTASVCVYAGKELALYGFGNDHPFGPDRFDAFWREFTTQGVHNRVQVRSPVMAERTDIERFHTPNYVAKVEQQSLSGEGFLDYGDTPAFEGVFEASSYVVGSVLDALQWIMAGEQRRGFVPIAGLHHARRDRAGGFCVFNDCGIAIETLRSVYGIRRVAYVDIDAHHGDGVFYGFEDDPDLIFADLHEDGRYLYPGTGTRAETGIGKALGTKLNIPMPPGADDEAFLKVWPEVEAYLRKQQPEFIILQCGADSINGDPLTHMAYSTAAHAHAAASLCSIADEFCGGHLLAVGGGGYNRDNLARGWTAVVEQLIPHGERGQ